MRSELITIFPPSIFRAISTVTGLEIVNQRAFSSVFRHSWKQKIFFGQITPIGRIFLRRKFGWRASICAYFYSLLSFHRKENGSDCFFLPSRNGFLIINLQRKTVHKFAYPIDSEPGLLDSESLAASSLPESVPRVLERGRLFEEYAFISSEFIETRQPVSYDNWQDLSEKVMDLLFTHYKDTGYTEIGLDSYLRILEQNWASSLNKPHFGSLLESIYAKGVSILRSFNDPMRIVVQVHAHGDVVPNNILQSGDKIYIFDWANGGHLNLFYDLMMQEFYKKNSQIWPSLLRMNLAQIEQSSAFAGWAGRFLKRSRALTRKELTEVDFQIGIVISLLEISFKNHAHYQFHSIYLQDGCDMLTQAKTILEAIR